MSWHAYNSPLSQADMEENALMIFGFFYNRGWTINAISALCGNMQAESRLNPGAWENYTPYGGGYGLTQWTPYTKLSDWATQQGLTWIENGPTQCKRIDYECLNNLQWFYNSEIGMAPPITFAQFSASTLNINTLSNYFLWFYEHPADPYAGTQAYRQSLTQAWYTFFVGHPHIPIWLLFKFNDWRRFH